jgi:hypothetical protein
LVPLVQAALLGAQVTAANGSVVTLTERMLSGMQLASSNGSLHVVFTLNLAGQAVTATPGTPGLSYDCNLFPLGVSAQGEVGTASTNIPPVDARYHLWAREQVAKLIAPTPSTTLFNREEPND